MVNLPHMTPMFLYFTSVTYVPPFIGSGVARGGQVGASHSAPGRQGLGAPK